MTIPSRRITQGGGPVCFIHAVSANMTCCGFYTCILVSMKALSCVPWGRGYVEQFIMPRCIGPYMFIMTEPVVPTLTESAFIVVAERRGRRLLWLVWTGGGALKTGVTEATVGRPRPVPC